MLFCAILNPCCLNFGKSKIDQKRRKMLRQFARKGFELLTDFTYNFTPLGNNQALNNARSAVEKPRQQKAFVDSRLASIKPDRSETTESA